MIRILATNQNLNVFQACRAQITDDEDTVKLLQCVSSQLEADQEITRERMRSYLLLLRWVMVLFAVLAA